MGIEDEHISMPYEPWTKGQIERSFGTAIEKFSKKFASYTGTLTGSKTDAKVPKEIKKMAEQGKLLTMEEFYEEWKKYKEKYIKEEVYHRGSKEWMGTSEVRNRMDLPGLCKEGVTDGPTDEGACQ